MTTSSRSGADAKIVETKAINSKEIKLKMGFLLVRPKKWLRYVHDRTLLRPEERTLSKGRAGGIAIAYLYIDSHIKDMQGYTSHATRKQ